MKKETIKIFSNNFSNKVVKRAMDKNLTISKIKY